MLANSCAAQLSNYFIQIALTTDFNCLWVSEPLKEHFIDFVFLRWHTCDNYSLYHHIRYSICVFLRNSFYSYIRMKSKNWRKIVKILRQCAKVCWLQLQRHRWMTRAVGVFVFLVKSFNAFFIIWQLHKAKKPHFWFDFVWFPCSIWLIENNFNK